MRKAIAYSDSELQIIGEHGGFAGRPGIPTYNTPVSYRENFHTMMDEKHAYWMPSSSDMLGLHTMIYMNSLGRGINADMVDVFGVKWIYEPVAGGSIAVSGNPLLRDVNEWKNVITIPDINSWNWEEEKQKVAINNSFCCTHSFVNGFWFERLISFMDFVPAAMALIDEEQTDAIKELFTAMTALGISVIDNFCDCWPELDIIEVHDDWGAQLSPFFSMETAYDLFVPFMKKLTDHIHKRGRYAMLHSCGHNETRIEAYIDGGFDIWTPQPMNDVGHLYEKYGDRICLGVFPDESNLAELSIDEQRAAAKRFVDKYCNPGKYSMMGIETRKRATPEFLEAVYQYSRERYNCASE